MENERLQAELRARLVELPGSRARLVEATDAERRRIERDLHDGTQQRLVSIAMSLGLLETKLPAQANAAQPIGREMREALALALTNAAKHSHGREVRVLAAYEDHCLNVEVADDGIGATTAAGGSGLRGLADRVEALAGRLTVSSPPGRGTTLRAEIPCA